MNLFTEWTVAPGSACSPVPSAVSSAISQSATVGGAYFMWLTRWRAQTGPQISFRGPYHMRAKGALIPHFENLTPSCLWLFDSNLPVGLTNYKSWRLPRGFPASKAAWLRPCSLLSKVIKTKVHCGLARRNFMADCRLDRNFWQQDLHN